MDTASLRLKYHGDGHKNYLIDQIDARRKLKKKLPEWLSNDQIQWPLGVPLEQSSSEYTAKLKSNHIQGMHLLDMTGGLGVDCYYLSKNFKHVTYVEKRNELTQFASYNYNVLGAEIEVITADSTEVLMRSDADFVYIDPHRRSDTHQRQFLLEDHEPKVLEILDELIKPGRTTLIKTSPMLDIKQAIIKLKSVSEVWVISLANDCKEVLYLLRTEVPERITFKCWNLDARRDQYFESKAPLEFHDAPIAAPDSYLYLPNSSIFKAGLQDDVAKAFQLSKLHYHSNIYTSKHHHPEYPGRVFKLLRSAKAWDKSFKSGSYNVVSRNFPEKASVIEKRLKLKPSDVHYLLATKLHNNEHAFLEVLLQTSTK